MNRRQKRANRIAYVLGAAATAAAVLAYLPGWLDWLEFRTLDLRFQYANSLKARDDIVCVGIDDSSLQKVGRWPWPRDVQAALISVPAELGAAAIVVDLTYSEPQLLRPVLPDDLDIVADPFDLARERLDPAFPDYELRNAIAAAGNVYLAVPFDPDEWDRSERFDAIVDDLRSGRRSAEQIKLVEDADATQAQRLWLAARIVQLLEEDLFRDDADVAARLGADLGGVQRVFERCRQYVLRRQVRRWRADHPESGSEPAPQLMEKLYAGLTGRDYADDTGVKKALASALREVLSYEATARAPLLAIGQVRGVCASADAIVPVFFETARAARRCGFVKFDPDRDAVMRRTELLAAHRGDVFGQLAFITACDALGVNAGGIETALGRIVLNPENAGRRPIEIQLDARHNALVPWLPERNWTRQFGDMIAADLLVFVEQRRAAQEVNRLYVRDVRQRTLMRSVLRESDDYRRLVEALAGASEACREARLRGRAADAEAARLRRDDLLARIEAIERTAIAEYRARASSSSDAGAAPDGAGGRPDPWVLNELEKLDAETTHVQVANAALQREIDNMLAWLRPRIEGRIVVIGYTATALADMTPIPTHPRAPGMMAHANLLNGLLSGRTVSWASPTSNSALAAVLGLLITAASVRVSPRITLGLLAVAASGVLAAAAALFYFRLYWLGVTPALSAMLLSYFTIASYRYFFVDRERRQLTNVLRQYTSPALARQMAENEELCRRAETREVTAMFTDLKGFTTISEQIGAERTQRVLNLALGRMSAVMLNYEAMINKFIGDGIFAFWNPVIYAQPDHAVRACETALDLIAGLNELIVEQRRAGGDEAFARLVLRIGVATGNAVVGPCGSEQKYDYTCIGDSVNVASRLESANKFFGTQILVSGATREQSRERFEFRPLGAVQVKGKQRPVEVYELLGRDGGVAADDLEHAARFAEILASFRGRDWGRAHRIAVECLRRRPGDLAAIQYAAVCERYEKEPPDGAWNGAIELTEK